jgi:tRNA(fMet)-specific endonuclease VapC
MFVVLDTNHFRELREASPSGRRLQAIIEQERAEVFSCIVAAEESLAGWLALIRRQRSGLDQIYSYERLQSCLGALGKLTILPFDQDAALIFHQLAALFPRHGRMDLKIAAICLTHDALLLSRNLLDFQQIPGLRVANWLD